MPTRTLVVPEAELERLLAQWLTDQGGDPQYRKPKCWKCGREMSGSMWHVFFRGGEREAHLCWDCGKPYSVTTGD